MTDPGSHRMVVEAPVADPQSAEAAHAAAVTAECQARRRREQVVHAGQGAVMRLEDRGAAQAAPDEVEPGPVDVVDSQPLMNVIATKFLAEQATWLSEEGLEAVVAYGNTIPEYDGSRHGRVNFASKAVVESWAKAGRAVLRVMVVAAQYLPKGPDGVRRNGYMHVLCSRQAGTRYADCDFGWFDAYRLSHHGSTIYGTVKVGANSKVQAASATMATASCVQVARDTAHLMLRRVGEEGTVVIHMMTAYVLHECTRALPSAADFMQWCVLMPVHLSAAAHAYVRTATSKGSLDRSIGFCTARLGGLIWTSKKEAVSDGWWRALRMAAMSVRTAVGACDSEAYEAGVQAWAARHKGVYDLAKVNLRDHQSALSGLASAVASGAVPCAAGALRSYVRGNRLPGMTLAAQQPLRPDLPSAGMPRSVTHGAASAGRDADGCAAGSSTGMIIHLSVQPPFGAAVAVSSAVVDAYAKQHAVV